MYLNRLAGRTPLGPCKRHDTCSGTHCRIISRGWTELARIVREVKSRRAHVYILPVYVRDGTGFQFSIEITGLLLKKKKKKPYTLNNVSERQGKNSECFFFVSTTAVGVTY